MNPERCLCSKRWVRIEEWNMLLHEFPPFCSWKKFSWQANWRHCRRTVPFHIKVTFIKLAVSALVVHLPSKCQAWNLYCGRRGGRQAWLSHPPYESPFFAPLYPSCHFSHSLPPFAICLEWGHRSQIKGAVLDKALTPDTSGSSRLPRAPLTPTSWLQIQEFLWPPSGWSFDGKTHRKSSEKCYVYDYSFVFFVCVCVW